jgi:hypothetical protein
MAIRGRFNVVNGIEWHFVVTTFCQMIEDSHFQKIQITEEIAQIEILIVEVQTAMKKLSVLHQQNNHS